MVQGQQALGSFLGVMPVPLSLFLHVVEELQNVGALLNGVVGLEDQLRGVPQGEGPAQLPGEGTPPGGLQPRMTSLTSLWSQDAYIDLGVPQVRGVSTWVMDTRPCTRGSFTVRSREASSAGSPR